MTQHHDHEHQHGHGHVHLGEADWAAMAERTERAGEVLIGFVTGTAAWLDELRGSDAPAVHRVLDVGSGPGVAACEFARHYPQAAVTAIDSSPAMLQRAQRRAERAGLGDRVTTRQIELPAGLDELAGAFDVVWASMSLHHVGDEVAALRGLGATLAPSGLLAVAEFADPMRVLPDDLELTAPGLAERLDEAGRRWFAAMRRGLDGSVPSDDLQTMVAAAGLEVVGARTDRLRLAAPVDDAARSLVIDTVSRIREQIGDELDSADRRALDVLLDADDPAGIARRDDVFLEASQQIVIARHAAT